MEIPEEVIRARSGMVTAVKQTIAPQLFSHTVILARTPVCFNGPPETGMKYLIGSGTLVQVDAGDNRPRYGVLTCGHVLGAFEQSMEERATSHSPSWSPTTDQGRKVRPGR